LHVAASNLTPFAQLVIS